jgi:NitT/TauT family transport system substrate-binding protein
MFSRKSLIAVVALVAAVAAGCGSGGSSSSSASNSGGTPNFSIMVGGLDKQIYLPFMLTEKLGYFKKHGVNVSLSDEPAGVEAANQLLAGKVNAVGGFYDHTIDLQGAGKQVQSVAQLLRVPGEVVLCHNDASQSIKSPADWTGKRLGVTGLGSSTYFLTQYLATHNGVPSNKITPVAVKAGPTFIAAMDHKSIDCGMTTEPTIGALVNSGKAKPLVDMRTTAGSQQALGGLYPATSLYMRNDYVASHKATVQKVVDALVETMHWIQTHNAAQITDKMPPEYYQGVGKQQYIKALEAEKDIFTPDGVMPAGGPETVLKVLSSFDPNVKGHKIDLRSTYTTQFAEKAKSQLGM